MNKKPDPIAEVRSILEYEIDEWLGSDIPDEGTEDYEQWQAKVSEVADLTDIYGVIDYLSDDGRDADQFFIDHEIGLLSAGLEAADVPVRVIEALGEKIGGGPSASGADATAYLYDGHCFVVRNREATHYPDKAAALAALAAPGSKTSTIDELMEKMSLLPGLPMQPDPPSTGES
jgi:hypothetical protein